MKLKISSPGATTLGRLWNGRDRLDAKRRAKGERSENVLIMKRTANALDVLVPYEAMSETEWAYLCGFLQKDLQSVLKLTNRELLRAVDAEMGRRTKRTLLNRILNGRSSA